MLRACTASGLPLLLLLVRATSSTGLPAHSLAFVPQLLRCAAPQEEFNLRKPSAYHYDVSEEGAR